MTTLLHNIGDCIIISARKKLHLHGVQLSERDCFLLLRLGCDLNKDHFHQAEEPSFQVWRGEGKHDLAQHRTHQPAKVGSFLEKWGTKDNQKNKSYNGQH